MAANGSSPDLFGSGDESDKGGGSPNPNRPSVACAGAAGSSGAGAGAAGPSGAGAGVAGPSGAGAGAAGTSGAGAGPYGDVSYDSESDDNDAHHTPPVLTNKIMRGK